MRGYKVYHSKEKLKKYMLWIEKQKQKHTRDVPTSVKKRM